MEYTISKENFLNWYYEDNMDETRELKEDLADTVIDQLYKTGKACITIEELFDECNTEAIRVCYIEGFNYVGNDEDREFSDLEGNNTIKLK